MRLSFKPALNSKGLRRFICFYIPSFHLLQASPEFKGIKTQRRRNRRIDPLQASPEFKGIKTGLLRIHQSDSWLQASPEFKGIKTYLLGVGG